MSKQEKPEGAARPIRAIYFTELTKWPEVGGAGMALAVKGISPVPPQSVFVENIFLYHGEFVVDGRFFIPKTCGRILSYQYA